MTVDLGSGTGWLVGLAGAVVALLVTAWRLLVWGRAKAADAEQAQQRAAGEVSARVAADEARRLAEAGAADVRRSAEQDRVRAGEAEVAARVAREDDDALAAGLSAALHADYPDDDDDDGAAGRGAGAPVHPGPVLPPR